MWFGLSCDMTLSSRNSSWLVAIGSCVIGHMTSGVGSNVLKITAFGFTLRGRVNKIGRLIARVYFRL